MEFHLHKVKTCKNEQYVLEVTPILRGLHGTTGNWNQDTEEESRATGGPRGGIQEPSAVLVFLPLYSS